MKIFASTKIRSLSGTSLSFIEVFSEDGTNQHWIARNQTERLQGDLRRLPPFRASILCLRWYNDCNLCPVRNGQWLCQNDNISLGVPFVFHGALFPMSAEKLLKNSRRSTA
jgi:hypothetical protein